MANKARGEADLIVPGRAAPVTLCLSLGAMAELESAFSLDDFSGIGEVLKKPKGKDVATLVAALAKGGGHDDVTAEVVLSWQVGLPAFMLAIQAAMKTGEAGEEPTGN